MSTDSRAPRRSDAPSDSISPRRTAAVLVAAWLMIAAVVVGIGWLLTHPLADPVGGPDNDLSRWFRDQRTPTLTTLADAFTVPGNTLVAVPIAAAVAVALVLWRREWRAALFVALGIAGVYGIYLVAVTLDPRDRPPVRILDPGLVPTHSFPSGHVAAAVVLYGSIAVLVRVWAPSVARWLVPLLCLVPLLVLVSRLYLGAHHLSDTLTSVLFAGAWLAVLVRALRPGRDG